MYRQHLFDELKILQYKPFFSHKRLNYLYCNSEISMVKYTHFHVVCYTPV